MTFITALLATSGAALIVTQGSLFRFLQQRAEFFRCPMCVGWWCGAVAGAIAWLAGELTVAECLALPFATSLLASLAGHLTVAAYQIGTTKLDPARQAPRQIQEEEEESPLEF